MSKGTGIGQVILDVIVMDVSRVTVAAWETWACLSRAVMMVEWWKQ